MRANRHDQIEPPGVDGRVMKSGETKKKAHFVLTRHNTMTKWVAPSDGSPSHHIVISFPVCAPEVCLHKLNPHVYWYAARSPDHIYNASHPPYVWRPSQKKQNIPTHTCPPLFLPRWPINWRHGRQNLHPPPCCSFFLFPLYWENEMT